MSKYYFAIISLIIFSTKEVLGAEAGMPQLDPEFWTAQIFWLVITFVSLYLIIWKIFLPKINTSIENRKSKVINDLNETQKLKENAEKKLKEYNLIIENSKKEAQKIIENTRKKLGKDIEDKKQNFNKEIEKELSIAEKEVENFKKSSLLNINQISIELSSEILKYLMEADVNKSSVAAIVDTVSKEKVKKYL